MSGDSPRSKLEEALITALRAIDNQVARELQRSPGEREEHGVQKWQPFAKRIEQISGTLLNAVGSGEIELDSLLVMSQSLTKSLSLIVRDLESGGLGKIRAEYCRAAAEALERDARMIADTLHAGHELN